MTEAQAVAMQRLLEVLMRENTALREQRYDMLPDTTTAKATVLRELDRAGSDAGNSTATKCGRDGNGAEERLLAQALRTALTENRRLLRQGMDVQKRIMALIAGAARREASHSGYGARGGSPQRTTMTAVALMTRA